MRKINNRGAILTCLVGYGLQIWALGRGRFALGFDRLGWADSRSDCLTGSSNWGRGGRLRFLVEMVESLKGNFGRFLVGLL